MDESEIEEFWAAHPCGEQLVAESSTDSYETFFDRYDQLRYGLESHIPTCLDAIDFRGREVLEIGLGQGADAEQIIRRGARWTGLDLTPESVDRVRTRLELRGLPYERIVCGTALDLPFEDQSFDLIFSHGVLHHIPDIHRAQAELARVLRPGGEAVIMLYAKYSLNYLVSISLIRRVGLLALYPLSRAGVHIDGIYAHHVENARRTGLIQYLRMANFIHRNTDGPRNPYSRVYSLADVRRTFASFEVVAVHKEFMHAPPLPVHGLPMARVAGWHLWAHLRPLAWAGRASR
jgi:SAM-dependent methyltransferase